MRSKQSAVQFLALFAVITASNANAIAHISKVPLSAAASAASATNPVKQAEMFLRNMGEPIHRAKHAAVDFVRECTRENQAITGGEIDFIGTDVIPIIPDNVPGLGSEAYLPPRKSYLDLHVSQLAGVLPILQSDIQTFQTPDPALQKDTAVDIARMNDYFADANTHFDQIKALIAKQPYDSTSIVREAKVIHQDIDSIDKLRKKIYDSIKRDPNDKQIENNAQSKTNP